MFWVSGLTGHIFTGPLEDLLQVHRISAPTRARRLQDDDSAAMRLADTGASHESEQYRATAAYTAALKPQAERGPIYHACQVMTRGVITVRPDATVEEAWRALASHGVGQAPVLDGTHRLLGLVSREDLLQVLNEEDGRPRDVLPRVVRDVMATPVVAAAPVTDIRRIARVMLDYSLPAVPILDESARLVGIVSRSDILKVVASEPPLTLWA